MRRVAAALTGASLALLALISSFQAIGVGSGGVPSVLAAADTVAVDITEDGFDPSNVTVAVGGTVTWTNRDSDAHSVVGDPGSGLESPAISRWGIYSRTFHTAGTITYHDGLHPELTGIINVVDGDGSSPAPDAPGPSDRVQEDTAPPAPSGAPLTTGTSPSPLAATAGIDAGNEWFGSSGFQNGVYEITIQAGDTVQWNMVDGVHTVYECGDNWSAANTCAGAAWNSDILVVGETFSQQFNTPGTFQYLCKLHPLTMRGSIIVEASAAPPADDALPPAALDTGPSTAPPAAPDAGPSASGPTGSGSPSEAAGPDAVPNAGFGPPPGASGLGDYFPLSVVIMAAAGLTFLGSSVMLIKQRMHGAQAAAVAGWAPSMVEPPRFRKQRADAQLTTAASGARMNVAPTLRPGRTRNNLATARLQGGQVSDHAIETQGRPPLPPDDLEVLRARLASIRARFARVVRKIEQR